MHKNQKLSITHKTDNTRALIYGTLVLVYSVSPARVAELAEHVCVRVLGLVVRRAEHARQRRGPWWGISLKVGRVA